jgi:hypothetical protein
MTIKTFYPPELFRFLSELAFKNKLSVKEVETVFLRKQAEALGFECYHLKVGFAKSDGKPYCKGCWARLEQVKPPIYRGKEVIVAGQFRPLKTFLDVKDNTRLPPHSLEYVTDEIDH